MKKLEWPLRRLSHQDDDVLTGLLSLYDTQPRRLIDLVDAGLMHLPAADHPDFVQNTLTEIERVVKAGYMPTGDLCQMLTVSQMIECCAGICRKSLVDRK